MSTVTVPTPETASVFHWTGMLADACCPIMLVGNAGCGKTQLVQGLLTLVEAFPGPQAIQFVEPGISTSPILSHPAQISALFDMQSIPVAGVPPVVHVQTLT